MRAHLRCAHRGQALLLSVLLVWMSASMLGQMPQGWQQLDQRAEEAYTRGSLAEAIAAARVALQAAATPEQRAASLARLGSFLGATGQAGEAEQHLRESLSIREATGGGGSLPYAASAHDLAVLYRDTGRVADATRLAERSLAIRRGLERSDDRLLQALDTYGSVIAMGGDYEQALTFFEEAVTLHEAIPAARRSMALYGVLCVNLGGTYQRLGRYEQAEVTMAKAREALRIEPGPQHVVYLMSTVTLAALKSDQAKFGEAEPLFNEAVDLLAAHAADTPIYPSALNNRGVMYRQLGNLDRAEKDLTLSLQLKDAMAPTAVGTATTRSNLAQLIYRRDRAAGERMMREAAAVLADPAAPAYEQVSMWLGLGRAERDRGDLAAAAATFERALTASGRLGAGHPLRAAIVREMALTMKSRGDLAGADAALNDALRIAEAAHGSNNPNLLPILHAAARTREARGDPRQAAAIHRRAFEIEDSFLTDVFAIGSESFKETVLASLTDPVHELIGFQERHGDVLPEARVLAFEAATRRKGRILEQVRQRRESLRSAGAASDPRFERLAMFTRCRIALMLALSDRTVLPGLAGACGLPSTDLTGRYEALLLNLRSRWTAELAAEAARATATLENREQALEAEIVGISADTSRALAAVTKDTIAARLQRDELLVEFVSYLGSDKAGGAPEAGRKYGAFVLRPDGQLGWIALGDAAPIERAAGDLLQAANDWAVSRHERAVRAMRASERTATAALAVLTTRVWKPLEAQIPSSTATRHLRLAPDSALNLVPFEALALTGGGVVLDRFVVGYLPAGRDLVRITQPTSSAPPVVVVSTENPGAAGAAIRAPGVRFPRIPNATAEARELAALLDAQIKANDDASERAVKALRSPLVLHLAGHGLVGQEACVGAPCAAGAGLPSAAMARSYMVLQEFYGGVTGSSEDGLLTAIELQNMDLSGTAMLVLSQCQMASGRPSAGEGVYGMRRAATVAGARTFVAPLWNVDDRVQRTLTRELYRGIVAGRDRALALRDAKLAIRRDAATKSFLYWAPVILSGDTSPLRALDR